MGLLFDIHVVVLILGGILAVSALLVAQKPNARQLVEKIAPYQTTIGLVLIAFGVVNFVRIVPNISGEYVKNLLVVAVMLAICGASILLGVLFGMGPIMHFFAGNAAAEQKAHDLVMKVAPYQVLIGLAGLAAALFYFLFRLHLLSASA